VTWETLCGLGCKLPDVAEGVWYRTPALGVRGRFFVRLKEDGLSVAFRLGSVEEQEFLTQSRGGIYYITDHYRGHRAVLARLGALSVSQCRERLEGAWRVVAPRTLVKKLDGSSRTTPHGRMQR
jgi:hypothetical protein